MKITVNQIHSIGDILFIEPIIRELESIGYTVDLPIRDHLLWLSECYPIKCLSRLSTSKMDIDNTILSENYLPLRFANQIVRNLSPNDHSDYENMMLDKYELVKQIGISANWKDVRLKFNQEKAKKLYNFVQKDIDYIIVNNFSQAGNTRIIKPKAVLMQEITGYTLIDWHLLLSNAREIHTVSTSIVFLLQAMYNADINVPITYIYPRPNEDGLRGIKKLDFSYNFKLVDL